MMQGGSEQTGKDTPKGMSQEEFLDKLRRALGQDGDFPTSARIVAELRSLTSNPNTTANQIAELILREPSLGARVLHIVNSSFYRRSKPIMTISQAVMRIGMKPLAELCAGLVLLQKFGSISRRGHAFSRCLTQTILTGLVSGSLSKQVTPAPPPGQPPDESGYFAGTLTEMGPLLLAYYFPEIYENAAARSEQKRQSIAQSITELVGLSPIELSHEIITALNLPEFYKEVMATLVSKKGGSVAISPQSSSCPHSDAAKINRAAAAVNVARDVSECISANKGKNSLDEILVRAGKDLNIDAAGISKSIGELSNSFREHCGAIDLTLPALPEFISSYTATSAGQLAAAAPSNPTEDRFQQFVEEIRQAVESRESSSSVITTVMETLCFGLDFERVLLLLAAPGKRSLQGRMALGQINGFDPKKFDRPLGKSADPYAPDAKAFAESRPVFTGDAVLDGGWPFVAIPIGFGTRAIGVIYADRADPDAKELTGREQAAIGVLAELIDRAVATNA